MPAQLAQALYDNTAESPEELSFRRGDVMLVLERDAPTLGGWWRCSLRGQQGIAPGNRLRLLTDTPSQENEYQAPRALRAPTDKEEPQSVKEIPQTLSETEVYEVPPVARPCLIPPLTGAQDDIYKCPRLIGALVQNPQEIYDMPKLLRDSQSAPETYDSPALSRAVVLMPPEPIPTQSETIPEDIYDVPPIFHSLPDTEGDEEDGVYSMPSNLKRVSGLQNLYEAPEDILSTGHPLETLEPPHTHRLSISSVGSARSVDSAGSRESNLPPSLVLEYRNDGTCTLEALRVLHHELQRAFPFVDEGLEELEASKKVDTLRDFIGMAHIALLRSCQASDPSLHRELSGHVEQLERVMRDMQAGGKQNPLPKVVQEESGYIVSLINANAALLFPRPRLSSSESLSRRPLPALPIASPATHRKGSIQDRPLPPPPTLSHTQFNNEETADSEYERIQCKDNHYVHLQERVTAQIKPKPGEKHADADLSKLKANNEIALSPDPSEEDLHLLRFYAAQSHGHLETLLSYVNTFLDCASSQPPRVFVGHGKQLVIAAHKLVFIGDTLGRLLSCGQLQSQLAGESGALCQALKEVVLATKEAAALYPSSSAQKAMVSSVSVLCTYAQSFTDLLKSLAS
ncbi:embryonal Fyn-associated substrate isoform X2 [Bombina bombina]|uniref:embryonal Fyn-associated substrate isoform X2 n=1 Tax=Bombina bombina TaxID=8345 RepID=UPI00235B299C|nr:embryonal Fyn-associated substrate isoform X2 [Bombina bombina]